MFRTHLSYQISVPAKHSANVTVEWSLFNFVCLFLAVLGLGGCTWPFSSFREQGLLSSSGMRAAHCSRFSCHGTGLQNKQAQQLWPQA